MNLLRHFACLLALVGLIACGHLPAPARAAQPQTPIRAGHDATIPSYAWETLAYIRAHHEAPPGFEGSRRFGNYEKVLPQRDASGRRIQYQEWDVHPHREHVNRGAERLVTGSDGRAWFTGDHYAHFTEMP